VEFSNVMNILHRFLSKPRNSKAGISINLQSTQIAKNQKK
jgi:hypothetical protein